jgi:hypothetical protein
MRLLVLLTLLSVLLVLRPSEPPGEEPRLGQAIDGVIERLGPPVGGHGDGEMQTWTWTDRGGRRLRVCVHAGVVVRLAPEAGFDGNLLQQRPVPARGPYPGQPVADLVRELGNPGLPTGVGHPHANRLASGPGSAVPGVVLVYGEQHVHVAAGRVLSASVPPKENGPR